MKINLIPRLLLLMAILCVACDKTIDDTTEPGSENPTVPPVEVLDKMVLSSFVGRVTDDARKPLVNARVKVGGKTVFSDQFGVFRFYNVQVKEQFAMIVADKTGFHTGYRSVFANENGSNFVNIKLISKTFRGTAAVGASISVDRASLVFTAGDFVTADSLPYQGEVKVYADYLDPESSDFRVEMPGDLRGINKNNQVNALQSFGMLAVELQGSAGQKLHLAKGNKVKIEADIPPSLLANAPASIPLWYFDDKVGAWKEEGAAIKNGNKYSGEVSHFSWWNCDDPFGFVYVTLKLEKRDKLIEPLPFTEVKFLDASGRYGSAYTDSTGTVKIVVPKNVPLTYEVIEECGEVISTGEAGPFNEDTDMGNIRVSVPPQLYYAVKANIVDCDNNPVVRGFASFKIAGLDHRFAIDNGIVDAWVSSCQGTSPVEFYAYDSVAMQYSPYYKVSINGRTIDVGKAKACSSVENSEYISYTIAGNEYHLQFPPDTAMLAVFGHQWTVMGFNGKGDALKLDFSDTVAFTSSYNDLIIDVDSVRYVRSPEAGGQFNIIKFGKVGEFVDVIFDAPLITDLSGKIYNSTGRIHIRRKN